ncbi:MAG: hypothetical protein ABIJ86_11090 [Spirochaetota bacterium]
MSRLNMKNLTMSRMILRRPSMNTVVAITITLVLFGGISLAKGLDWWKTTGGRVAPAVIRKGVFAGVYDPADIRGSTSLGTIEAYFNLPADLVAEAFGIQTSDPRLVTVKFADTIYGEVPGLNGVMLDIGTDAVRLFVASMTGLPFSPEEATGLPESAIDMILTLGAGMSEEQRQDLVSKTAASRILVFDDTQLEDKPVAEVSGNGFVFQGKTSFADVMAAGLTQAQIESVLGRPMGPKVQSVKDFCDSKGLGFSTVRAGLSQLMSL